MIIYRTTNNFNGMTYIGLDTKNNPKYFGSGIYIVNAINKYGKKNFTKTIVEDGFNTLEDLFNAEIKWIKYEKENNPNGIYNIALGGSIGWNNKGRTFEEIFGEERAKIICDKISETNKRLGIKPPSRRGTTGSQKQKDAVSKANKDRERSPEEIEKAAQKRRVSIICINTGQIFASTHEAAKILGLSQGNVSSVLNGIRENTKGLKFRRV